MAKEALPRLAPRLFGCGHVRALGEGRGLSPALALEALHLGLQHLNRRPQLGYLLRLFGKLPLLRDDQPQQFVAAQRREVFRDRHSVNCKPLRQRLQAEPLINYGFTDGDYAVGIDLNDNWDNWNDCVNDLKRLRSDKRVWMLFSHVYHYRGVNEEKLFLHYLDGMGVQHDSYKNDGVAAYLYEMAAPVPISHLAD